MRFFLTLACLTLASWVTADPLKVTANDEASCMHLLARRVLRASAWQHLRLEDVVYFRGPLEGARVYTLYAVSSRNTPRDYKIQFAARWNRESNPRDCELSGEAVLLSSGMERILHSTTDGTLTQLEPVRFPLLDGEGSDVPDAPGFGLERTYARRGANPLASEVRVTVSDPTTVDMLSRQGIILGSELIAARSIGRVFNPTRLRWRVVRQLSRATLYADAASRLYLVMAEETDPGIFPLGRVATSEIPRLARVIGESTVETGVLRAPRAYLRTFYDGTRD